jgi:Transcriptional regulators
MIADGELAPGDRLPPERKLAESLGVSRGSLRQAFHILAERGIIESRQGDGTYLLAPLGGGVFRRSDS